jgi:hypothetical protein
MSDHLPVVMNLETNKEFIILNGTDFDANSNPLTIENTIVKEELHIKVNIPFQGKFDIEIFNILGQKLLFDIDTNTAEIILNVSHLPQGVYYLNSSLSNNKLLKFLKAS